MPRAVEVLSSSTFSRNFLDEWSAVHFFASFKLAQAFGFWPSVALHVVYEFVVDPMIHTGARSQQSNLNRAGDLAVGVVSALLGARYRV